MTRETEFIALVAAMMSVVALTIDAILPAFSEINQDFGISQPAYIQMVVTLVFAGLTFGQLFYGPIADRAGRKPAFAIGMGIFLAGCLLSTFTNSFELLLAGRFLQGFGAASFRICAMAIVRDQYEGAEMARIVSFAMSLFMVVPCIAPLLGQTILIWFDWRLILLAQFAMGLCLMVWFWLRQKETLLERENVGHISIAAAFREALTTPVTFCYTLSSGLMLGSFMGYLVGSHHVFVEIYDVGERFALYFAALSIVMGAASFTNGKIVRQLGSRRLVQVGLTIALVSSGLAQIFTFYHEMTLPWFMLFMTAVLSCMGFVFGNMNAIAMEPLGHIAGVATSVISFVSGMISVGVGSMIGSLIGETSPIAVFTGFFLASLLTLFFQLAYKITSFRKRGRHGPLLLLTACAVKTLPDPMCNDIDCDRTLQRPRSKELRR